MSATPRRPGASSSIWFTPLPANFVWMLRSDLGYGGGIGDKPLPFFKAYYAGGVGSVRGYDTASLGPQDNQGNTIGGRRKIIGNAELFFPLPGAKAKPLGAEGNPPSKLSAMWFGKWWYWGDYPAHTFTVDEIRLEAKIERDAKDHKPEGDPLARVAARVRGRRRGQLLDESDQPLRGGAFLLRKVILPNIRQPYFFYWIYYGPHAAFHVGGDEWTIYGPRLHVRMTPLPMLNVRELIASEPARAQRDSTRSKSAACPWPTPTQRVARP